jgi:hypothetical protein
MPFPKDYPLESFDPRFRELLARGARGENFTIQCKSESQAHRLQHMLHSFRNKAKQYFGDEAPEHWKPLYLAVVARIRDEHGKKTIVHIFSRQDEFGQILGEALPDAPTAPSSDPLAEFEPHNGSTGKPEW